PSGPVPCQRKPPPARPLRPSRADFRERASVCPRPDPEAWIVEDCSPMKVPVPAIALVLVTAAATAAVILPSATAEPAAQQATTAPATTAPAPELVTGLPDFTRLVEQVGPGVVSIEATIGMRTAQRGPRSGPPDEIPEIFRRFFGPGFPFGGQPGDPRAPAPRGLSMGTGFLISSDGYLLTNHHVVANAEEVRVRLHDHRQY